MTTKRVMRVGLLSLLTATLLAGGAALANHGMHNWHDGKMKEKVSEHIDQALDAARASAEQRTAIHAARDHVFATIEETHQGRADFEQGLALLEADRLDGARIAALRADHEAKFQKVGDAIVQAVTDAHDALTAEQRGAVVAFVRAHKPATMGEHHRRGAGFMKTIVSRRIDEALDHVQASAAQRATVAAARDRLFASLEAEHDEDPSAHIERALALFAAERVDPAAVQTLRDEHLAKMRRVGDSIAGALTTVHDALTPAQRHALAEWIRAQRPGDHG